MRRTRRLVVDIAMAMAMAVPKDVACIEPSDIFSTATS